MRSDEPPVVGAPLRILVVCTANVCRSPVTEHLLQRHLDLRGVAAVVRSAGTHGGLISVHHDTATAAERRGVDLGGHVSRALGQELLQREGADLIVTMTREHLRHVVSIDPGAWPRTFTLKELVRRGSALDPTTTAGLGDWRAAAGEGRTAAAMMGDDPTDDVADPYGRPAAAHTTMVTEVDGLTSALARLLAAAGP